MQSGSLEWHQKGHAAKNNVILHKKSDYKAVKNEIALQCKRKKNAFGLLFLYTVLPSFCYTTKEQIS